MSKRRASQRTAVQPYLVDDPRARMMAVYMQGTGRVGDPLSTATHQHKCCASIPLGQGERVISNLDDIVAAVVQRLRSWSSESTRGNRLHCLVDVADSKDAEWLDHICQQLPDRSVYLKELHLSCNTQLALDQLVGKLASSTTVHLYLNGEQGAPRVIDNLPMLQELSEQLCNPGIKYVEFHPSPDKNRRRQAWILLNHAANFTCQLTDRDNSGEVYHSFFGQQLVGQYPRSVRLPTVFQVPSAMCLVEDLAKTLTSLELNLFTQENSTPWPEALQPIHQLSHLHSLSLTVRHHMTRMPSYLWSTSMLHLLRFGATCTGPLDTLHATVEIVLMEAGDHRFDAISSEQARRALGKWKSSIVDASATSDASIVGSHVINKSTVAANVAPLQDELNAVVQYNRGAVANAVRQLVRARRITELHIAPKVLAYVHDCYSD